MIADQNQPEVEVMEPDKPKDRRFESLNSFPDAQTAQEAFARSVDKLFTVNRWSNLSSFTADFALYDSAGRSKPHSSVEKGDYIQIMLPGPLPENWVYVLDKAVEANLAEFTVRPCADPGQTGSDQVNHFFTSSARSTFRVELTGSKLRASEIGQHELINNQGPQAGDRAVVNTLIAETGWLFYQKIQWQQLTDFLVHL